MKLLNDIYKNGFGTLEVETEPGSVLNYPVKFGITYSLEFDDTPSDEILEEIEDQDSLINVLKCLEQIDMTEMSFKSFSIGFIEENDEYYTLVLTIESFMNLSQEDEDITEVGREYKEVFPELMEMLDKSLY